MRSNSRVLRGWRDFGVKATAIILTILLATQMVGTPAFASGALTNKQASEDIATTVDDTGVEPSGTEATDTTVPDEAAGAANEPAPADSTQATEEPVVETVESATEPATETPAADPAANTVLGTEPEPTADSGSEPAPAVEQNQLASLKLILADGTSITLSKDGNKIDDDTNPVDVPANEELKFTAQAADGWQIDAVKTDIDGVETELTADANGEYKVAADKVTDKLTVKVEAVEVAAEEPATNEASTPTENDSVSPRMAMLLNTALDLNVTFRYYDASNNVTKTEETTITSGVLEEMAPEIEGYYFLDATISTDNVPIAYAEMHDDGNVYYALEKDALTGILLEGSETIYLNYKELGNSVRVHYTTSGEDRVDGNEVIGFPETATKGEAFSFQVALARGYEAVVSVDNRTIDPSVEASGVNTYSVTVNEESTVNVEFVKTQTVTFDPGVFNDSGYVYLAGRFNYTNGSGSVEPARVGENGADFSFSFRTNGAWQLDSLQINGIYLNVPHTRNAGDKATTVLYQDGSNPCLAILSVTNRNGNTVSYQLSITGAKENLMITEANLNGVGWHEVVPSATEGIDFWSSPSQNGSLSEGGLNKPYATDSSNADGSTPKFQFSVANGYKNPAVHVYAYNNNGDVIIDETVELPANGERSTITTTYMERYWNWFGWDYRKVTVTLATITNNNGTYTIQYASSDTFGDSGVVLQFVEITCEKATYGVKYELGAGTGQISDSNTYDVVDNATAVVTNRMPEAPEGQIFLDWKIKGNENGPSYAVGDALDFTSDDIFRYVGNGDGERDGYLTLVAMYTDQIAYGSSRPVNVKYFFENENDEFVEDEDMRTTVQGVAGKQLSMLQHENTLEHDGYEYTFDADASKTTITVTGDNAIELRYALERVEYTYNAGEGGSVDPTSERVVAQKEGAAKGSVATANDGYEFDCWSINVNGEDIRLTDSNANDYNVALSNEGKTITPRQNSSGVYEGGVFTAQFKAKEYSIAYEMVSGTEGEDVPQAIKDMAPTEPDEAKYKADVTFEGPAETEYYEAGKGTWKFQGWSSDEAEVEGNSFTMPAANVTVTGTWTLDIIDVSHPDINIDDPESVPYDGGVHQWVPTVTDNEGNTLTPGEDYTVSYSTDDFTNVGTITVTITGTGNYGGSVEKTYQITPVQIVVNIENQTKVEGSADPTFTFNYSGVVEGETMAWTGEFVREVGETAGDYAVTQGGFVLADNPAGGFDASNYTLVVNPGTLTITAATTPVVPDTPDTPTPMPDTPGTPTPVPTPAPGDGGATPTDGLTATTGDDAEEAIDDEATPLTAPEPIDDDATPLAANEHRDCWVHWLMLLGILVTVVYYGGVGVRRVRFSSSLQSFEDDVLGNDETNR